MAKEEPKKQLKKKAPTALKRVKQSKLKRASHNAFKSRVRTATRSLQTAITEKDKDKSLSLLGQVHSLIDKGVKIGIYKKNKAARDKSRFALLSSNLSST